MVVLGKPFLQLRYFRFRVEADAHARLRHLELLGSCHKGGRHAEAVRTEAAVTGGRLICEAGAKL